MIDSKGSVITMCRETSTESQKCIVLTLNDQFHF